jgi:site-specific DNA-methyltransferase (adenine-specific)
MSIQFSGNDNYATPDFIFAALEREFGITLDPCPLNPEPTEDGLQLDWTDQVVFCNPPWSNIAPWVEKALISRCTTVLLLPARTDVHWFHQLLHRPNVELRFFRKRVHFIRDGVDKNPTDGTLVAIVRGNQ